MAGLGEREVCELGAPAGGVGAHRVMLEEAPHDRLDEADRVGERDPERFSTARLALTWASRYRPLVEMLRTVASNAVRLPVSSMPTAVTGQSQSARTCRRRFTPPVDERR